ncbi:hypothetical protein AB0G60_26585 [Streptomyces angustmyceticus]|uniref:Uncharacterized protein n=1 Tax=Streptomyces angustmyceticus TaxID=285578 RepID=A0A5J4LPX1_9ACTN|nr:hypothetical protein [Streptomyces angustmyceticus]UAL65972.1 hypothetical protein K7396_04950 [Streptomyces angustmyceticus]GES33606.1 hypothetical protein San01_60940 [Streptomyces angustmyceticus]
MPAPRKYPDELSERAVRRVRTSVSIRYDERLIEAGASTSVGSVADSDSNAMTATVRDRPPAVQPPAPELGRFFRII